MNKEELIQEIVKLGCVVNDKSRRMELEQHLQALREEGGVENRPTEKSEYQKKTIEMNKRGNKKADLVKFMEEELGCRVNPNSTMVQLRKEAVNKIYLTTQPDETDPVGFGKYHSLTYGEVENHHKEYASWVINTAREDNCCPQLVRLATWLQRTTGTISKKGSQKSPSTGTPRRPSETPAPSTQSSPSQADTETAIHNLVGALQSLQKEVQELKEDRKWPMKSGGVNIRILVTNVLQEKSGIGRKILLVRPLL